MEYYRNRVGIAKLEISSLNRVEKKIHRKVLAVSTRWQAASEKLKKKLTRDY